MNIQEQFTQAQSLMAQKDYGAAAEIFVELQIYPAVAPFCYYQLATISNATGDPLTAYDLYYKALETMPNLAGQLCGDKHSSHTYVFQGKKEEKERLHCPFCAKTATPRWCYPLLEAQGYNAFFNPIRMWMYCEPCHHMFARHFPEKLFLHNTNPRKANPAFFSYYSQILGNIRARGFAQGMDLFEIGIGASECLLAAREIGYDAFGIDVIERHVEDAKNLYGLNAETADINEYKTGRQWDVIIMGDVLEHVTDPEEAMKKVNTLMKDDGAVWISTPSFESAFSAVAGHNDAMRRQQYHLNYFSRESLYALLDRCGLMPVDYHISSHYNGSMEVVAVKTQSRP
ncbi:MAG: class I SAM-dependent methyltransferase [Defluviitaleaceae bacterium]|nr:class I SAM-dependent methyltransferase [Defluviitaleaceae bacterium]MCL2239563.1 class I SAM-dependent methyltransferase [Defluviitaleaceae bacterium]